MPYDKKTRKLTIEEQGNFKFKKDAKKASIVIINKDIKSIPKGAFSEFKSLETVEMENVKTIEENAFKGCKNLTAANMPAATEIGKMLFRVVQT